MSLRKQFKTDKKLEAKGIEIEFPDALITVARAGGSNKKYKRALAKALKPFKSAVDTDSLDEDRMLPVIIKPFVDEVLLDWKTWVDGAWVSGIEGSTPGAIVEFTKENATKFLLECPELYYELQEKAVGRKLFLEDMEEAAKN